MRVPALRTPKQRFCLLELDQPLLALEVLSDQKSDLTKKDLPSQLALLSSFFTELMQGISPEASGVILSPEISYYALDQKAQSTGVAFSLEKQTEASDPLSLPTLTDFWGVEQTKNNYALAKLRLQYHPSEPVSLQKKQLVHELFDYCQYEDIDFMLELELLHEGDQTQALLESIDEFRSAANLFVLSPSDALTAVTITAELDAPWILTGRNMSYERYKEQLRICLESGGAGFLVGPPLWADVFAKLPQVDSVPEWQTLLKTTVRDRFLELARITNESALA